MWILPKPLHTSLSAPATEALISDSQELSEQCAQSLLVRSKPSPVRTWSQKWKRDSWTSHLSGRILKPSRGSSFAAQWTSSLEASLVSLSAPQDDAQETMIQDTFGHTSSEASNSLDDLPLFSLRTSKASSHQSSAETIGATKQGHRFCSMSSESWSAWVTKQRRAYSVRVKSAPPINASASLSSEQTSTQEGESLSLTDFNWRTPTLIEIPNKLFAVEAKGSQGSLFGQALHQTLHQEMQAQMWATARAGMAQTAAGGGDPSKKAHKSRLENQVQTWLTPAATAGTAKEPLYTAKDETSSTDCSTTWPTPKALEVDESVEQHHTRALKKSAKNRGPSLTVAAKMASQPTLHQEASSSTSGSHQESLWTATDRSSTTAPMSSDSSETVSYQTQPQEPSPSCGESWSTPRVGGANEESDSFLRRCIERTKKGGRRRTVDLTVQAQTPEIDDVWRQIKPLIPTTDTDTVVQLACIKKNAGKLNPRWVETLMGLPVGWVRPSADDNDND